MTAHCKYCVDAGHADAHGMTVVGRLRASQVLLLPDQTYYGRCVVVFDQHRTELFQLDDTERADFMADVSDVAAALTALTACKKINYAAYGDLASHLHFHVVPKSPGQADWGDAFRLNPQPPVLLDESAGATLLAALRRSLSTAAPRAFTSR
jgi:diadenosine tetraphosphate (Ap4A) HIT family hydrolase